MSSNLRWAQAVEATINTVRADRSNRFSASSDAWTTEQVFEQLALELWWEGFGLVGGSHE